MNRVCLRVGRLDVEVVCADAGFVETARSAFTDLTAGGSSGGGWLPVVFDVSCRPTGSHRWSIRRDGEPCELTLSDEGVLPHLQWELNRLMIESNPLSVHAAAVTANGVGVLLPGRSCSGKSTLAGWLSIVHGFGYLGDEVGAIDDTGAVLPFPRPVGVRVESPLAGLVDDWSGEAERVLPISRLGGRPCLTGVPVSMIVFPHFTPDAAPVWTPVRQADCMMRLTELTPGLGVHGRPVFEQLARLARSVPAFDVVYGRVADAARMVADVC